jgi:hypothetical protein
MDDIKTQIRQKIAELQTALRVLDSLEGAKPKPRTILTEAFEVLKDSGKPLRLNDILMLIEAKGVAVKEASLRSALKQDGHKVGIARVGRGLWWIAEAGGPSALTEAFALFKSRGEDP